MIGLLFATPYIFKGKIVARVKKEINKNLTAQVDFKEVDISLFRHFPKVSIGLDDVDVIGTGYYSLDTLMYARRLDATVDIMSFIRGKDMNIYELYLESPRITALVSKEGLNNWDILKEAENKIDSTIAAETFNLKLEKYAITNGYVKFVDLQNDVTAVVENLEHTGSGDFTADLFTLKTTTSADAITYTFGAIPFLSKVKTNLLSDIKVDNKTNTYSFDAVDILLNELRINGKGNISSVDSGYKMDFNFRSPSTEFKNILSLIPAIYTKDFNKITADGKATFEGYVKGIFRDSILPGYHVAMEVKDGSFKYTDLPKAIEQINFKAVVDNPDGQNDNLVVDITNGHLEMDKEPFDFRLLVKKPISNMYVDAAAKGKLNLTEVASYIKLENGSSISGVLNADVNIKGNVNDIENYKYNNFYGAGTVDVNNFNYTSVDYPTGIKINTVKTSFTPMKLDVADLNGQYQNSNFNGSGQINNLLSYLLNGKPLSASLIINADRINLNDWLGVTGDTATTTKKTTASEPFMVPANLDIDLYTQVDEFQYDKINIRNLSGILKIEDEVVKLNDVQGEALDGTIKINGSYSTKYNKVNPAIALSYDVSGVDVQKTFYAFNTGQKLMPIGKYLSGKLTSILSANGNLGDNMDIEMSTMSGSGNLFLIEGFLSKFAPLDKIASVLQVKQLEQLSLKDVKTFFEFSNGKLLVKPFTLKIKDIEMEIGGLQGFDETINYAINLKLPRALMGAKGNQLINSLAGSISTKGIPLKLGETVNLKLALSGTITNPFLKVDLKQTGETLAGQMTQQVKDFAQAKIDSVKNAARDTLISIKKQLSDAAKEELRKKLFGKKDTALVKDNTPTKNQGDKTKESIKGLFDNLLKKRPRDTANKPKDTIRGNK